MKTRITILLAIIISTFLIQSCTTKKKAKGPEDVIHVVADTSEYLIIKDVLKETFGKIIHTPQPEELFTIQRHNYNNLNSLKLKKNIIIAAPINSGSFTSKYLESIVDSSVTNLILKDSAFVINKYDLWAENQLVMILSAKDVETLKNKIVEKKEDLFYYFREASNKRLAKGVYNPRFEQKEIEAKFIQDYGWMIYMQADYKLAVDSPEDNFVWIRRGLNTDMERWIFVHWIENSTPAFLHPDSISIERDKMTKKFYTTTDDSAYVVSYDTFKMDSEVNFNDKYALMTQGLWKFNNESGGGPYISYSFYDEETRRVYMLDASVFAPKYYKKSVIQQVDVLLHSFKTESEIDSLKKQDILEALED